MLTKLFAPLWAKIIAGVGLALIVAVGVQTWRLSASETRVERLRDEYAVERANHAVTRASLNTLATELERMVKDGVARAERIERAERQVAFETAPLRAEAERIEREGLGEGYAERLKEAGL